MRLLLPLTLLLVACEASTPAGDDTDATVFRCDVAAGDLTPDPRLLRFPYLTSVTTTSATIQWGLPVGTTGALAWGRDDTFGAEVTGTVDQVDALVTPIALHHVTLDGLEPDTSYCYRLTVDGADLAGNLAFRTAPPADTERRVVFLAMGDYGTRLPGALGVRDRMREQLADVDFWLTSGDNAYAGGSYAEWDLMVFDVYKELMRRVPYFPVPGNHDYGTGSMKPMTDSFVLPRSAYREEDMERYYAFDWGPLHFSMLDSEGALYELTPDDHDDQMDFYRDDLAANASRPWPVGVWHHPAYTTEVGRSPEAGVVLQLIPATEAAGVPLVLSGHVHAYERFSNVKDGAKVASGGTTYITTGGGGASTADLQPEGADSPGVSLRDVAAPVNHFMRYEVDRCSLVGIAIDLDGNEIDRFELTRC